MKSKSRIQLGIYAAVHFLVDLGCAVLLLGRICPDSDPMKALLLYNLFAFAVQMPVGLLADRFGRNHLFAAAGCLAVAAGWLIPPGIAAAVTAGLGNAAFHVGGGLYALNEKGHRAGPLGLFVSPGAFGVYLGGRLAAYVVRMSASGPEFVPGGDATVAQGGYTVSVSAEYAAVLAMIILLLGVAAVVLVLYGSGEENAPLEMPEGNWGLWTSVICLFLVVVLRSLLGLAADFPWKAGMGFASVCAVVGGKAAGGYLADRFGMMPVAVPSLGISALCFLGGNYPAAGLAALFFFNMTMPLTLWAMAEIFAGAKGFSFGLLTFGLFLGFLPVYFGCGGMGPAALAAGALLSLILLGVGLRQTTGQRYTGEQYSEGKQYGLD